MKNKIKKILVFLLLSVLLIIPDQLTKAMAVKYLYSGREIKIIDKVLYFLYLENRGAAFGVFKGKQIFFYIITLVVIYIILKCVANLPHKKRYIPLYLAYLLVFSGGIGNFIDRIKNQYVVDFIYFKPIDFPVFNVADIYVSVGFAIIIIFTLFYYKDSDLKEIGF